MQARLESSDRAEIEGEKIEKQRAIRLGRKRNHLAFLSRACVVVDPLQVGGFTAETRTIVDKLAVDLASRKIDKWHRFSGLGRSSSYIAQRFGLSNREAARRAENADGKSKRPSRRPSPQATMNSRRALKPTETARFASILRVC